MKKLIAVAVLSAFAAPAFADSGNVTISGYVRGGYEHYNKAQDGTASQNRIDGRVQITFSGTEDLGNGLSTVWGVTTRSGLGAVDETGDGLQGGKEAYLGLSSNSWGQFRFGHDLDNYNDGKHNGFTIYGGEFFGRTDGADISGTGHTGSTNNAVRYDLPAMGNFTASVRANLGENHSTTQSADKGYTLRADYDTESWDIGAAYNHQQDNGFADSTVKQYNLTGAYRFGNGLELAAEYERTKVGAGVAQKETMLYVNYAANDKLSVGGELGYAKNAGFVDGAKNKLYGLYAHYSLSKRTQAFGEFVSQKQTNPDTDRKSKFIIGLKHSF
ncbi:porin [Leeia oryzae]|uniref:porin n=1 Tax=Leeia oryzae TaxID=356662 RepID=UPI000369848F|nr:porin [Leeia oryzae]